ncbi:flagellar hook-associated protein FlgK [Clostridium neonatale]|uniref:flagellar hook-associated protein FlgK n=1 Tax=Clostridium neonatale TaxID=137838 RepID=UPI003D341655
MAGLLDTFNISKRGLNVQQSNINTSSHNIANANTVGYSRQRSVIETTRPFGGASRFDTCTVGQVGTGAEVTAIQRVRDQFLDYQVRSKTTEGGTLNIKYQYLYQTENILNDSSDAGIQNALNKFFDAFQELSKAPQNSSNRTVAITQASALADMINSKYTQLEQKKEDAQKLLSTNVTEINDILDSINSLNKQISSVAAVGMTPNDLMDKRDNLLDELSSKLGINVDRDKNETINVTATEYGLNDAINKLVSSSPNDEYNRFSYISEVKTSDDGKTLTVTYDKLGNAAKNGTGKFEITCADEAKAQELKETLEKNRVLVADSEGTVKGVEKVEAVDKEAVNKLVNSIKIDDTTNPPTVTTNISGTDVDVPLNPTDGTYTLTNGNETLTFKLNNQGKLSEAGYKKSIDPNDPSKILNLKYKDGKITNTDTTITSNNINNIIFGQQSGIISGEIAGNQAAQKTIQDSMDQLDKLAISLAYTVNAIQTGSLDGTVGLKYSDGSDADLIFVVKDGTTDDGISAKNISLNSAIKNDSSKLICGENISDISGEKQGTRALAIGQLANLKIDYNTFEIDGITREAFFKGNWTDGNGDGIKDEDEWQGGTGLYFKDTSINQDLKTDKAGSTIKDYYVSITSNLGLEVKSAKDNLTTVTSELESFEEQRLSVSGVSLDEEMTDLITFQHAYQANAKMINTIDQLLDVVINGLKA